MKKTLTNLATAFVGECQARNRYTYYASVARTEGFEKIAETFLLTADQEKEHAKRLLRIINQLKKNNQPIAIDAKVPTIFKRTDDNLAAAIAGENYEHVSMYPVFARIAEEEGLVKVATRLRSIAIAEKHHEERYRKALEALKAKSIFKKAKPVNWVCRECGYEHLGVEPPAVCPSCDHPRSFYEIKCEEF